MFDALTARGAALGFWAVTAASALLSTALYRTVGDATVFDLVSTLIGAGLITVWYERDARERDAYRHGFALLVFFFAIVAVPVHLVRSRGGRGAAVAMLKIVGAAVAVVALATAFEVAVFGAAPV